MKASALLTSIVLSSSVLAGSGRVNGYGSTFLDSEGRGTIPAMTSDRCQGGLRHDDGSFEGAVGWANATQKGAYGMAFDLPADFGLERVCVCFTRGPYNNSDVLDFQVKFHADDGLGPEQEPGYPGTLLGLVTARAQNVPEFNVDGVAMYPVPLPPFARNLSGRIHVAVLWQPFVYRQFFLCNDAEPPGSTARAVHEGYGWTDPANTWFPISPMRPTYRALGTVLYGDAIFDADFEDALMTGDFECRSGHPGCA